MSIIAESTRVVLEIGRKKVFAVVIDWPGWCRQGRDEASALRALVTVAPRYAQIAQHAGLVFPLPENVASFTIVERLEGNATTDFGAPAIPLATDWAPIELQELDRTKALLTACWRALDEAVEMAEGRELQKGPRGGGRDVAKIVEHVVEAEEGYLRALGWKPETVKLEPVAQRKTRIRRQVFQGLEAATCGQIPREGPRGAQRWSPRFFVRRLAWHGVDHAWEIENRLPA